MDYLTENLGRLWSSLIIDELVKCGVHHFYISPGLRNAPLIAAVSKHSGASLHLGFDERSQSYRALGCCKAINGPSVLICTSGSALANFMPAIIEAKKGKNALFIITADRPPEMTSSDANQTIYQDDFYSRHVSGYLNLGVPTIEISADAVKSSIANLIFKARFPTQGPVHLNCPFREPLDGTIEKLPDEYVERCRKLFNSVQKTQYYSGNNNPHLEEIEVVKDLLNSDKSGIIVVGSLPSNGDRLFLRKLLHKTSAAKYIDVGSSLKYEYNLQDNIIPSFDHEEVKSYLEQHPPDFVIQFGGRLVSNHYYKFLDHQDNLTLVTINESIEKEDPSHQTGIRIVCSPDSFAEGLLIHIEENRSPSNSKNWDQFVSTKRSIINESPLTYPSISKTTVENLPDKTVLYLGNSTVIRSFDSYISKNLSTEIKVVTHRGASGIEGFLSSSIGYRDAHPDELLVLVLGDMSFLHDLNALAVLDNPHYMTKQSTKPFIIILVNNGGGGIFSLLPIAKDETIINSLYTPHGNQDFEKIIASFNIVHKKVTTNIDFEREFKECTNLKGTVVIEAIVNNEENTKIYNLLRTIKL
ncbi:2-succinyl-5-enolpyruvyl-6-hydroxy-3-cyclohexene-1-carboxylic-acid synthase [Bacteriovoracaceae bacterium]|nr:2-succinyl-5-enolpyruvyl-6-hydroxy-3-cyclohexene-1-carboxylic-acid synthase [Bacteriovoracaceae bacterium]